MASDKFSDLTKREYFAGRAMQMAGHSVRAREATISELNTWFGKKYKPTDIFPTREEIIAKLAVMQADALVTELAKVKP